MERPLYSDDAIGNQLLDLLFAPECTADGYERRLSIALAWINAFARSLDLDKAKVEHRAAGYFEGFVNAGLKR